MDYFVPHIFHNRIHTLEWTVDKKGRGPAVPGDAQQFSLPVQSTGNGPMSLSRR